ncbi:TPA: hypothetical protein ACR6V9_005871, partial [Klebsiella pneumoniae]
YFNNSEMSDKALYHISNALVISAIIKLFIIAYSVMFSVPIIQAVKSYGAFFETSLMTYAVEDSVIGRIQFTSDSAIPFILFYFIDSFFKGKNQKLPYVKIAFLTISIFLGMSRFYWGVSAFFVSIAFLSNIRDKKSYILVIAVFICGLLLASTEYVQSAFSTRFSESTTTSSDLTRVIQLDRIEDKINLRPILGNGLGYYIPDYLRSYDMKYSYELQVPALTMQIGFCGVFILLLILISPILNGIIHKYYFPSLIAFIMFVAWFMSGFFNPVLFSSAGGIAYSTIIQILRRSQAVNQ